MIMRAPLVQAVVVSLVHSGGVTSGAWPAGETIDSLGTWLETRSAC